MKQAKQKLSFIVAMVMIISSCVIAVPSALAAAVQPVVNDAGWALDFSGASDGDDVPFTLTNAAAAVSDGALQVTPSAATPRLVYNGGDFSADTAQIEKIVITEKTASGKKFKPYFYFGGTFSGTNVFKSNDIPGTGAWQEVVIDPHAKTVKVGETDYTSTAMPEGLSWSGTINAFRLDNASQSSDFEIQSIKFLKYAEANTAEPVDGVFDGDSWIMDFTDAADGAPFAGTLRNATAAVSNGALALTPANRDPSFTSAGTSFTVDASKVTDIRVKVKLPANATGVQMFFKPAGGSMQNFGSVSKDVLTDLGNGWSEYVINTASNSSWSGTIEQFRFDVDCDGTLVGPFEVQYFKFIAAPKYIEGVKNGGEWSIDFSNASDSATPVINADGDDKITTNATYSISSGALLVTPANDTVIEPRIAVSNRSNFSVNTADIDKICFKIRTDANIKFAKLYFATASGSFSPYLSPSIGEKDSQGWQELTFYSYASDAWTAISDPITKFRFDLRFTKSASYEVQSIRFMTVNDNELKNCSVSFDGSASTVREGYTVSAPANPAAPTKPAGVSYTFYGWAVEGTNTLVTFPYIVTGDVSFKSLWRRNDMIDAGIKQAERFFIKEDKPAEDYAYSFCVVPDTQVIVEKCPERFDDIYDWIVENHTSKKMAAVLGLGDITQYSNVAEEWTVAKAGISKLNGVVPYTLIRGSQNHDDTVCFNQYLNTPEYTNTLGGLYEPGKIDNAWRTLKVGGVKYLIMMLDFGASDAVLDWASDVIEAHPNHRVIITTHAYLYSDGTTLDANDESPAHKPGVNNGLNNGDEMWDKLISQHENIFLVLCGHIDSSKVVVTQTEGVHGNLVTQMLINFQGRDAYMAKEDASANKLPMDTTGMVAMLYFANDGESVDVETYSTTYNMHFNQESQITVPVPKYVPSEDDEEDEDGPVDGKFDGDSWIMDFADAADGALFNGTLRNATAAVSNGALAFTPTNRDPGFTSVGTTFAADAEKVKYIRVKVKLPANATGVQMFYKPVGKSMQNFGTVSKDELIDLGSGWSEYIIDASADSNWSGNIEQFRFDVDCAGTLVGPYEIKYIKFLAPGEYLEGVKSGGEWSMDFFTADDGTTPVINAHGDDSINTNATYSINNGALLVTPLNGTVTEPRIAVSNRSNFSVNSADIDKICFKVKTDAKINFAKLYFATASGSFSPSLNAVIGDKDDQGWQELTFYSYASDAWTAITDPITKFRFDLRLASSASYEVQSIRFMTVDHNEFGSYTVSFDGNASTVGEGYVLSAPSAPAAPTKPAGVSYTFYGWAVEGTSTPVTFPYTVMGDVSFKSLWRRNDMIDAGIKQAEKFFVKEDKPAKDYAYSFCVVPDTQVIVEKCPERFDDIYDWIVENHTSKKMAAVLGLGDITQYSNVAEEWTVAKAGISKLNGVVPYTLIRGSQNHDDTVSFNQYLNTPAYTNTVEGLYEPGKIDNAWRTLSVGGVDYLIMMLDFGASDAVLDWAGDVIEAHPNHRVIITTHGYLYSDGTTLDANDDAPPHKPGVNNGLNNGDEMWDKLVSQYENIFLVLCGHIDSSKVVVTQTEGVHGNLVTQMLIDFQGRDSYMAKEDAEANKLPMDTTGMVAMLYFANDGESIDVETYSTTYKMHFNQESQMTVAVPRYTAANDSYPVKLQNPGLYKDSGRIHFVESADGDVTAKVTVELKDNVDVNTATLIMGAYNGEVLKKAVVGNTVSLSSGETEITAEGVLPDDVTEIRLFVMDSMQNIIPLSDYCVFDR